MVLPDILLVLGATMRLTRLVVTDDLGALLVREPASVFCDRHGEEHPELDRLFTGLTCPFCVGYWLGAGVLASYALACRADALPLWRFTLGTLALSEAAGHLSLLVGDVEG